jgi:hypothetical protein
MSVRLGVLGAIGAAVLATQLGVAAAANAATVVTLGATGTTSDQASQNFDSDATSACASHGGVQSSALLGVTQQGTNDYYAEGYVTCNQ